MVFAGSNIWFRVLSSGESERMPTVPLDVLDHLAHPLTSLCAQLPRPVKRSCMMRAPLTAQYSVGFTYW